MRHGYTSLGNRLTTLVEPLANSLPGRVFTSVLGALGVTGRTGVIAIPYLWLFLFFLVPFAYVLKISLAETLIAKPPY